MWSYKQGSGACYHDDRYKGTGYSGLGEFKNCPSHQDVPGEGPIPAGDWKMTYVGDMPGRGPVVIRLTPLPGTETFGRGGFLCHGDSKEHPGAASHGCVIAAHSIREEMKASIEANGGEDLMRVTAY